MYFGSDLGSSRHQTFNNTLFIQYSTTPQIAQSYSSPIVICQAPSATLPPLQWLQTENDLRDSTYNNLYILISMIIQKFATAILDLVPPPNDAPEKLLQHFS